MQADHTSTQEHKSGYRLLYEEICGALEDSGYGAWATLEAASRILKDVKAMPEGAHKIYVGDFTIKFRIARKDDTV